jgi:hypothetical protein
MDKVQKPSDSENTSSFNKSDSSSGYVWLEALNQLTSYIYNICSE